mgnify:CR=1 FL=1
MTPEQQAAYINAQAVAASVELEAMKAANWMREMQGHTIAYGEEEFLALIDRYGLGHNAVLTTFGT